METFTSTLADSFLCIGFTLSAFFAVGMGILPFVSHFPAWQVIFALPFVAMASGAILILNTRRN